MLRSKAGLVLVWAAIAAGGAAAAADTDVVINEVFYSAAASGDWVELKNTGSETIDVSTWWLCSRVQYGRLDSLTLLDGDLDLGPGEIVRVGTIAGMGGDLAGLNDTESDLALYVSANFVSSADMVDFLQWGTDLNVGRSDVAEAKGIWTSFAVPPGVPYDFVELGSAGQSVAYCGTDSGGGLLTLSTDFENTKMTPGVENVPCGLIFADGFESGNVTSWAP